MSFQAGPPYPIFFDTAGDPLESGQIYFGVVGLDPTAPGNRITVYWDSALTIPAQQPVRTSGGYLWLNGSPQNVYIPTNYSILVQDKNGRLVYQNRNAGSQSLTSGLLTSTVSDLDFDPTTLGMQVNEVRLITSTSLPANPPDVAGGTFYVLQLAKVSASEYRLTMTQGSVPGNVYIRSYAAGVWSVWEPVGSSYVALSGGSSPFTLVAWTYNTIEINAVTNPFVFNLPSSATCSGYRVKIIDTSSLATGLIRINPFAGDRIGPMPVSTAVYLQNVDQAGWFNGKKSVDLVSDGTGSWAIDGQWMPEPGSVDTAQTQYYLGRLRLLPEGNATARQIANVQIPAAGVFTAAFQATGVFGIPTGAKAIWARVIISLNIPGAGEWEIDEAFSDNSTSIPSDTTSHSVVHIVGYRSIAGISYHTSYLVIPLNSSGQFFAYNIVTVNVTIPNAQTRYQVSPLGYYMGD